VYAHDPIHAVPDLGAVRRDDRGEALRSAFEMVPGRNCWRVERAARLSFLIDGAAYFGAVRSALAKARRSIFIIGWDVDSRMRLTADNATDGFPQPLGDFLNAVVASRRDLHGYVLSWDFAMLYALEREWLPLFKLDWRTHRRLAFRLDDQHPIGASHHQKIVVVDDAVAFVSGYDLTRARWDTNAHIPDDPRRVDHRGVPYAPFHDVGVIVAGACARALGELARERWHRATGRRSVAPLDARDVDIGAVWPDVVDVEATNVDVALARTEPAFGTRPAVSEIRTLWLDAIASARKHVYAEHQYFTSRTLAHALARRLESPSAPDVAVVAPYVQCGWLEEATMGVLRARVHHALRRADRAGRYRMYCPRLPELRGDDRCLNVHSKVTIVDDDLAIVGSANFSDRSLGLDTECNLALHARGDAALSRLIASLRERLLAEHLDCTTADVARALRHAGSLHGAIAELSRPSGRRLEAVDPPLDADRAAFVPDPSIVDSERPIDPDRLVDDLVPEPEARNGARARLVGLATLAFGAATMALAWRVTPLHDAFSPERLIGLGQALSEQPWAPLAVLATYVAGGLVAFPLLVLVVVTAAVFGPVAGPLYTFAGASLSAAVTFALGRRLGRETVRRLAGARINELSRRLAQHGLLAVTLVRMLPIAPFSVVNVVAGASHLRFGDFILGTLIGLVPGVVTLSLVVDRALAAIRHPGPRTFALLGLAVVGICVVVAVMQRTLAARTGKSGDTVASTRAAQPRAQVL